jgi:nucleoside-diphosphate-sugar epimerase
VRAVLVRFPPSVHGAGDHGFVPAVIGAAREHGVSIYVGDGTNRWAAVHRLDAARLFRLALESAPAGARLHAVGDEGVPFRDIATVIGRHLGVPVEPVTAEEAQARLGFIGAFAGLDVPASAARTRELLGWEPVEQGLIADLEQGHYFQPVHA